MRKTLYLLSLFLPWRLRRCLLCRLWRYDIHPTAHIGLSWVMPARLVMGAHARIGHLTVCKNLEEVHLGEHALVGNGNWITGFPRSSVLGETSQAEHFGHQPDRSPVLLLKEHAAITNRHLIDCTHTVRIGRFATVAGFGSQILTHSIDLEACRQSSAPVSIGDYCFVGTDVVVLGGSILPAFCVLGAKSLLNKPLTETHRLYAGVPARPLRELPRDLAYFQRSTGFVT